MTLDNYLADLPDILQTDVIQLWTRYQESASPDDLACLQGQSQVLATLPKVWGCSPFIAHQCIRRSELLTDLIQSDELLTEPDDYSQRLQCLLPTGISEDELMQVLRKYRQREMVRIAWRDLAGWATLNETLKSLSDLADAILQAALDKVHEMTVQQFGTPCNKEGKEQSLVVLGLGKLGGQELNFSSDIDLIFAYPETGETVGNQRSRTNQEFFVRLGQKFIHVLNHVTADGFVFRVDMRLRPFGDSGPLAMSFDALEDYYQVHARDWERYALVKARVCAGDKQAGHALLKNLRPFVYRRYLDFHAFEALRDMKSLIDQEARRKGLINNIKLGKGGIREVEFTCQVFQLIRGGRQPALQQRHLLSVLDVLKREDLLSNDATTYLKEGYRFLRQTENHLQAIDDRQTQTLPEDALNQTRLAYSMGFESWDSFVAALHHHQNTVHYQFSQVIAPSEGQEAATTSMQSPWKTLWLEGLQDEERAQIMLAKAGFQEAESALQRLQQLENSPKIQRMSLKERKRLDQLIPLLLANLLSCDQPDLALSRILDLIETVAQRSVYLALLIERPQVLQLLVQLCAHSEWIAKQITRYPLLLDELLDKRRLYDPLSPTELDNALQAQLAHLPTDDLELQMDSLCQFQRAYVLRVAASELSNTLNVEVASDYLTALADTLVGRALHMAWDYLVERHGYPMCQDNGELRQAQFCIVAYGKAGGIEMSYGSDLDIVFLHDSQGEQQETNGDKCLDNNTFFMRLARRIIHILTTNTPAGNLYEVDSRLRPGGNSGLLVSSLTGFEQYQQQDAWTWEHQALVRARAIAGDNECRQTFEKIRRTTLMVSRDTEKLKQDVLEMRVKMRDSLDKSNDTQFDIKQGVGGIADIEFIVQYLVLRWAKEYPQLLETTGMLPMLKRFVNYHLLSQMACEQLSEAYRAYRAETHRLVLQNQSAVVDTQKFAEYQRQVLHWWQTVVEA